MLNIQKTKDELVKLLKEAGIEESIPNFDPDLMDVESVDFLILKDGSQARIYEAGFYYNDGNHDHTMFSYQDGKIEEW